MTSGSRSHVVEPVPATEVVRTTKTAADPVPSNVGARCASEAHRTSELGVAAVIVVGLVMVGLVFVFGSGTGGNLNHVRVGGHG